MEIKITADEGWEAAVLVTDDNKRYRHVQAHTRGTSQALALAGAEWVLDALAKGREALVRVSPEAQTSVVFDTKEPIYSGFVRFSFSTEPGQWQVLAMPLAQTNPLSLGNA